LSTEEGLAQVAPPQATRGEVEALVRRFDRNRNVSTRPSFKETQVRVEFVDLFFEALGRDVRISLAAATVPADKKLYQRQIEATDQ
jgi:hypothetical protein